MIKNYNESEIRIVVSKGKLNAYIYLDNTLKTSSNFYRKQKIKLFSYTHRSHFQAIEHKV